MLLSVFRTFEAARGLVVNPCPDRSVAYLVVRDRDAEDEAYEMFAHAYGLFGESAPEFVAVPLSEAGHLQASEQARIYPLP